MNYLLSRTHPHGRFKAAFFKKLGYDQNNWESFTQDLKQQHLTERATEVGMTSDGKKYRIEAPLVGPNGRKAKVVTIWIVENESVWPRLVTAYPGGE